MPPDWTHRTDAWGRDMGDSSPKLDLMEVGTRWKHYAELRELFALGIEAVNNMSCKSTGDLLKKQQLESAVELIDKQLNRLSDFMYNSTYGSKLRHIVDYDVDNIYHQMQVERKINDAKAKLLKPKSDDDSESPTDYTTK